MKIAVVSTFDYPCGIGLYTENIVREWRREGHDVWCLADQVPRAYLRDMDLGDLAEGRAWRIVPCAHSCVRGSGSVDREPAAQGSPTAGASEKPRKKTLDKRAPVWYALRTGTYILGQPRRHFLRPLPRCSPS